MLTVAFGVDEAVAATRHAALAFRAALDALQLSLVPTSSAHAAHTLSAVRFPEVAAKTPCTAQLLLPLVRQRGVVLAVTPNAELVLDKRESAFFYFFYFYVFNDDVSVAARSSSLLSIALPPSCPTLPSIHPHTHRHNMRTAHTHTHAHAHPHPHARTQHPQGGLHAKIKAEYFRVGHMGISALETKRVRAGRQACGRWTLRMHACTPFVSVQSWRRTPARLLAALSLWRCLLLTSTRMGSAIPRKGHGGF